MTTITKNTLSIRALLPWLGLVALFLAGVGAAVLLGPRLLPHQFHGTTIDADHPAPAFTLTGGDGQPVSLADYHGRAVLLFFGYTSCPDVCPTTLQTLSSVIKSLGSQAGQAQALMISVDPEKDTPERMQAYINLINPEIRGLTGSPEQIAAVARDYGIYYEKQPFGTEGGYLVDHTATVLLIDPQGKLRVVYAYGTPAADILDDVKAILREE